MKLGKASPKKDPRTLRLAKYLKTTVLPPLPIESDWTQAKLDFGMMGNDTVGDCTCATLAHARQIWTLNSSDMRTMPDTDVLAMYSAVSGYDSVRPESDQGAVLLDVLNYARKRGLISAYVSIDPQNFAHMRAAVHYFGGIALGVEFLEGWTSAPVWSVPGGPVVGGHAVFAPRQHAQNGLGVISWGRLYTITPEALLRKCDEAYALFSADWLMPGGLTPSALNLDELQADLLAVTH